jgi:hypothetical protein
MSELYIFNEKIENIFQLLGKNENDTSYSVGYALANSSKFLESFLKHINIQIPFDSEKIKIRLQTHEKDKGFTDFEIIHENEFHIIIEAKRGWTFPDQMQLSKYISRPSFSKSTAKDKRIVVFNESTPAFTKTHFGISYIQSAPVEVISWNTIQKIATKSKIKSSNAEKRLLNDLIVYLDKISTMQKIDSNWVYVVSLGSGGPESWNTTWLDIVYKDGKYFHPVGGGGGGWFS